MAMIQTIAIERVAHIGIRVRNLDRALAFYRVLGFELRHRVEFDDVSFGYDPDAAPILEGISFVAEPGSKNKLSKRKIAQYLKNPDFKKTIDAMQAYRSDQYLWWQVAEYTFDSFMIRSRTRG